MTHSESHIGKSSSAVTMLAEAASTVMSLPLAPVNNGHIMRVMYDVGKFTSAVRLAVPASSGVSCHSYWYLSIMNGSGTLSTRMTHYGSHTGRYTRAVTVSAVASTVMSQLVASVNNEWQWYTVNKNDTLC